MQRLKTWQKGLFVLFFLGAASLFGLSLHFQGYKIYRQYSESMIPTLRPGDRFAVNLVAYGSITPEPGHLVTYKYPRDPGITYVSRVAAGPGDLVPWQEDVIPMNHVFLLCDNRDACQDSRDFGPVSYEAITGKAEYLVYSFARPFAEWFSELK